MTEYPAWHVSWLLMDNGITFRESETDGRHRSGVSVQTLVKRSQYLMTDALARARMETT